MNTLNNRYYLPFALVFGDSSELRPPEALCIEVLVGLLGLPPYYSLLRFGHLEYVLKKLFTALFEGTARGLILQLICQDLSQLDLLFVVFLLILNLSSFHSKLLIMEE
jgi:hypothetical protein